MGGHGSRRRQTLMVAGQPVISYTFDKANRLTQISQATAPVPTVTNFTYDADSRRSSLVLPNGITTTYCYDADPVLAYNQSWDFAASV